MPPAGSPRTRPDAELERELDELPIGTGRAHRAARAGEPHEPDERGEALGPIVALPEPAAPLVVLEVSPRMLKPPLKSLGRVVNWKIRRDTGVETDAGVMRDEQADAIAEPGAEILNRYELPRNFVAQHAPEVALAAAIYEYVQETVSKTGIAIQQAEDAAVRAAGVAVDERGPISAPAQPHVAGGLA